MAANGFFSDIKEGVSSALVDTTRTAGQISNEDLGFYRSSNSPIISLLEQQNERLLQLARSLTKIATSGTEVTAPKISDADSIEDNWKGIVDVFDNLLEKADACLDEYTGVIKRLSPAQEEQIKKAAQPIGKQRPAKAYQTQNIAKPQLLFPKAPRNDETSPFKPLLRSKPHAIVPLKESLQLTAADDGSKQYGSQSYSILRDSPLNLKELINTELRYKHPYETEIKISVYPPAAYKRSDPTPFLPYEKTKATLVDTLEAVIAMLQELKRAKEIAVDLEHHDEHSYIGLVSLMQISTRDKDWIVDTLKPWREDLKILNEVFADPRILKVSTEAWDWHGLLTTVQIFHGAYMDMIWLQRDFGLYVVGLFDTYHASRALGYPKHSLAYLLKHFADFDAAKQYQMADWRIRFGDIDCR
ncbi:exosome nuclease subunit [Mycoblastus sanguinarius]|nr:exosome nuclease subunit [Mycoblastus sanguinarius]